MWGSSVLFLVFNSYSAANQEEEYFKGCLWNQDGSDPYDQAESGQTANKEDEGTEEDEVGRSE